MNYIQAKRTGPTGVTELGWVKHGIIYTIPVRLLGPDWQAEERITEPSPALQSIRETDPPLTAAVEAAEDLSLAEMRELLTSLGITFPPTGNRLVLRKLLKGAGHG